MYQQIPRYCQHFEYLKISQALSIDKEAACKYCFQGPNNLWMCLSKGCLTYVCPKNNFEHLHSHLQQSRRMKKFHSIFINCGTTQIRCVQCMIQIGDLDIPSNQNLKNKQDPFVYRVKMLPGLADLVTHKIVGQLQNSEGHRKISRGLVGLFAGKYNYSINAAIQFLSHSKFIRQLILQLKISENNRLLLALRDLLSQIESAEFRAIYSDAASDLLYKQFPRLLGYQRKDPFEIILHFFHAINEETIFYTLPSLQANENLDEWDMFYKKNALNANYIIYSAIESTLSLNYHCLKCNRTLSVPHNIQFLKLTIPKKKRRAKEIQKELASHRYDSPMKNRRKSLINLFKQQECPITLPELIIDLMKSPLHKDLICDSCSLSYKKTKIHFQKLPDILIIQIARLSKDGTNIDETPVQLSTQPLDMGSFSSKPDQQIFYDFQSAICIEKGCLYPIMVVGQFNKQNYVIRNQLVELCKAKLNPYILCYKKRPTDSSKQKLTEITDDLKSDRQKNYMLPDFWYLQLSNGIEREFKNQFICKHNLLKPQIESKMIKPIKVSSFVYEDLHHFYHNLKNSNLRLKNKNSHSNQKSPKKLQKIQIRVGENKEIYTNQICEVCGEEVNELNLRRKKQREYVLLYDKLKGNSMPYCMISVHWIKRWSNFLYGKESFSYMPKGYPLPLSIDNKYLLDGNKCKPNLVKNEDYKVLNIYLWKFLKQLYGGGPQIRYKWKQGREGLDEEMITNIKSQANDLKYIYSGSYIQSPKKLMTSLSYIEKSSMMEEANESMIKPIPLEELQQQET